MPYYLHQATYGSEGWAALIDNPHDRVAAVRATVEALGGALEGMWLAFGDVDVVAISRMPDNVSAAALSMAISAGHAVGAVKTTPLLTFDDGVRAMRKAGESGYQPPSDDFWKR